MADTIEFRDDMVVELIDSMGNDDSIIRAAKIRWKTS